MRRRSAVALTVIALALVAVCATSASQQGQGQTPSPFPLSNPIRERGTSVSGAFEGWYRNADGSVSLLVGYFNRNTKQELDIPVGPNSRIEPGGPDQGQPTHFLPLRQWGVFSIKVPKDFGNKKLTWTLVANGFTNSITLHTKSDYIVEPFEDAANKNTPPMIRFKPDGPRFTGPPAGIAEQYSATVGSPLPLPVWITDEGPKINIPEPGRGRGRGRGRGTDAASGTSDDAVAGGARGRGAAARSEFTPPPPLALAWSMFRGPAAVKFENVKPSIDKEADGKASTTATFSAPGEYVLRVQGNDSTGEGGGGFQCCWTNVHVAVSVKPAPGTGGR